MIYFISNKKQVKIGFSNNPQERLCELQTANPLKLKLIGTLNGSYPTESELHKVFKKFHIRGEWFRYDGFLKCCIIALKDDGINFKIKSIRDFQRAGHHLQIRQKMNRNSSFNKKVTKILKK